MSLKSPTQIKVEKQTKSLTKFPVNSNKGNKKSKLVQPKLNKEKLANIIIDDNKGKNILTKTTKHTKTLLKSFSEYDFNDNFSKKQNTNSKYFLKNLDTTFDFIGFSKSQGNLFLFNRTKGSNHSILRSFLDREKKFLISKEIHLNHLRSKSFEKEMCELYIHPQISKKSEILLKKIKRSPLYEKSKYISKSKSKANYLTEEKDQKHIIKNFSSPKNLKYKTEMDERYKKFYQDKLKWKKEKEEINSKIKIKKEIFEEKLSDNYNFSPSISKNSQHIIRKIKKNRSQDILSNTTFYENGIEIENIDKFKSKLKYVLSNVHNYSGFMHSLNQKKMSRVGAKQKKKTNDDDMNYKINENMKNQLKFYYRLSEMITKKYKVDNRKDNNQTNYYNKYKIKNGKKSLDNCYEYKLMHSNKNKIRKGKADLYKLNIRQGMAWNKNVINTITSKPRNEQIIKSVLSIGKK